MKRTQRKRTQRKRTQHKRPYKGGVIDFVKIAYARDNEIPMIALNDNNKPAYNPVKKEFPTMVRDRYGVIHYTGTTHQPIEAFQPRVYSDRTVGLKPPYVYETGVVNPGSVPYKDPIFHDDYSKWVDLRDTAALEPGSVEPIPSIVYIPHNKPDTRPFTPPVITEPTQKQNSPSSPTRRSRSRSR